MAGNDGSVSDLKPMKKLGVRTARKVRSVAVLARLCGLAGLILAVLRFRPPSENRVHRAKIEITGSPLPSTVLRKGAALLGALLSFRRRFRRRGVHQVPAGGAELYEAAGPLPLPGKMRSGPRPGRLAGVPLRRCPVRGAPRLICPSRVAGAEISQSSRRSM